MNKLFVFQKNNDNEYVQELEFAYTVIIQTDKDTKRIELDDLTVDYLLSNSIDVVISNGLNKEWYFTFKGLKIVTITIDNISLYKQYSDVILDYLSEDSSQYFTGKDFSLRNNKDLDFNEIVNLVVDLDWDSEFFGFPIAYLSCKYLTESIFFRISKYLNVKNIRLIEYLCNCHDNQSVTIAEKDGFHFSDIRLTFEKRLREKIEVDLPESLHFRSAEKKDIPELKKIAKDLYKNSRYYFDGNFEIDRINEFYSSWVEKAVLGTFDDNCYCLDQTDKPIGYCTIKYLKGNNAQIGLVGISSEFRGKKLGNKMLSLVFNELFKKNINSVYVVTQGRNYSAQRLYQSVGFLTKSTELWYHKWRY